MSTRIDLMNFTKAYFTYYRTTALIGGCLFPSHGYIERKKRFPILSSFHQSVMIARDSMAGAIIGPIVIPYFLITHDSTCPLSPPKNGTSFTKVPDFTNISH